MRPAHAISIEEARRAPSSIELQIQLDDPKHAWASLLLAAAHGENAMVRVGPEVAINIAQLIDVTRRSLRGSLPCHLVHLSDSHADFRKVVTSAYEASFDTVPELEPFPEPQKAQSAGVAAWDFKPPQERIDRSPARYPVHHDLWRIFSSTRDGREALARLEQALSREAPDRDAEAARLLKIAGDDTPIAHLITAIVSEGSSERQGTNETNLDEIPGPRAWSPLQLARVRYEAFAMCYSNQWNLAPVNGEALTLAPK